MTNKRLYRSTRDRLLFGVAGGLAEYFNIDPTLVRLLIVGVTIFGGHFIIVGLYLVMALVTPEEPGMHVSPPPAPGYPDAVQGTIVTSAPAAPASPAEPFVGDDFRGQTPLDPSEPEIS